MKRLLMLILIVVLTNSIYSQLLDNYDGVGDLSYTTDGVWVISGGQFEAQTGALSTPDHSYASYDLNLSNSNWSLSRDKQNEWIGWMDLNYSSGPNGWGANVYNCGIVLAANNNDFNETSTSGYALGFRGVNDELVIFRFPQGITGGTGSSDLPPNSNIVVNSGYIYSSNGVNFYIKLNNDGKWTIKYKDGIKLSDDAATNPSNYTDGTSTSSTADETYSGSTYKWSGWVYAHNTGSSEKAYFDNFGIGTVDQSLPVELQDFNAVPGNSKVTLCWSTGSETENLGFNLYRSVNKNGEFLMLNAELIPGHGSTSEMHEYSYTDRDVVNGVTYYYKIEDVDYTGITKLHDIVISATPSGKEERALVEGFRLQPCFPNPFNPKTTLRFELGKAADVSVQVYDLLGNLVNTLTNSAYQPGEYSLSWNGRDAHDRLSATGIYFLQISSSAGFTNTQKVIFLR